mmetsp:Transcript_20455/g.57055  ORF Transcript_20455/g.57055 Transcript_20455/m.57055 type:complete len:80 (-) Transcript_20455:3303-3542(-)
MYLFFSIMVALTPFASAPLSSLNAGAPRALHAATGPRSSLYSVLHTQHTHLATGPQALPPTLADPPFPAVAAPLPTPCC